jgi:hypothetical protein
MSPSAGQALAPTASSLPTLRGPHYPTLRSLGMLLGIEIVTIPLALAALNPMLAALLPVGLFLTWVFWLRRQTHEVLQACNHGADLLDRGRFDEAERILDDALSPRRVITHLQPVAAYHRARLELYRGHLVDARARLVSLMASGWFRPGRMLQALAPQVQSMLALTAALQGDLDDAERATAEGKAGPSSLDRWWYLPDAVLALRRGRPAELLARMDEQRDDIEATLSGRGLRQLQLLEAFALAQLAEREDNYRGVHSGADVDGLLHGLRPGSFDFMVESWPQLREFMATRRLLRATRG